MIDGPHICGFSPVISSMMFAIAKQSSRRAASGILFRNFVTLSFVGLVLASATLRCSFPEGRGNSGLQSHAPDPATFHSVYAERQILISDHFAHLRQMSCLGHEKPRKRGVAAVFRQVEL